jgi:hypothetical protein
MALVRGRSGSDARAAAPGVHRYAAYGAPQPSPRLVQRDMIQYSHKIQEVAHQRRLERELFAIALAEEDAQRGRSPLNRSPEKARRSPGSSPSVRDKPHAADQAVTEPKSEQDTAEAMAKRKAAHAQRKAFIERLATLPKLPQPPPIPAAQHSGRKAIPSAEFNARFFEAQVRAQSARKERLEKKYAPELQPHPKINPMPGRDSPDWDHITTRLYTQEMHHRKAKMEKLQQKFAPSATVGASSKVYDADIAARHHQAASAHQAATMKRLAEQDDKRAKAACVHAGKKMNEERWKQRLTSPFISPRGRSPT